MSMKIAIIIPKISVSVAGLSRKPLKSFSEIEIRLHHFQPDHIFYVKMWLLLIPKTLLNYYRKRIINDWRVYLVRKKLLDVADAKEKNLKQCCYGSLFSFYVWKRYVAFPQRNCDMTRLLWLWFFFSMPRICDVYFFSCNVVSWSSVVLSSVDAWVWLTSNCDLIFLNELSLLLTIGCLGIYFKVFKALRKFNNLFSQGDWGGGDAWHASQKYYWDVWMWIYIKFHNQNINLASNRAV